MSEPLYSISYFSKSKIHGSPDEIKAAISNILETAHTTNSQQQVTGALLFSGGYFVQVLEGPESAVEEIFESIQNDLRHHNIAVIQHSYVDQRSFSQWSMALAGIRSELVPGLETILKSPEDIETDEQGAVIISMLTGMLDRYEEEQA